MGYYRIHQEEEVNSFLEQVKITMHHSVSLCVSVSHCSCVSSSCTWETQTHRLLQCNEIVMSLMSDAFV